MELLAAWGIKMAAGFIYDTILEDLAKDSAKAWAKDYLKGCIKNVIKLPKNEQQKTVAKAIAAFLHLVQEELENAELSQDEIRTYTDSLKKYLKDITVAETLGSAFKPDCKRLDTKSLLIRWNELDLKVLPEDFDWDFIIKAYLREIKKIRSGSVKLSELMAAEQREEIAASTKALAGIPKDFDLRKYREGLTERYGNLNLESLDTSAYGYDGLKLWRMFIPQNARACQEYMPQVYEIPKEFQKQLAAKGEIEAELSEREAERLRKAYQEQPVRKDRTLLFRVKPIAK